MKRTGDDSVPIGSDWETSKRNFEQSRQLKKTVEIEQARTISQVNYGIKEEGFNPNKDYNVVKIRKVGERILIGFIILFIIWIAQIITEYQNLQIMVGEKDPEEFTNKLRECNPESYDYDVADCADALYQEAIDAQETYIIILIAQIFAWLLIASDLIEISSQVNAIVSGKFKKSCPFHGFGVFDNQKAPFMGFEPMTLGLTVPRSTS